MPRRTLTDLEYRLVLAALQLERERVAPIQAQTYETMAWVARQHDTQARRVRLVGEREMEWDTSDAETPDATGPAEQG